MFRYLRYLVIFVLAVSLLTVALANRTPVTLNALPDGLSALVGLRWSIELPLFLVILGGIVAGIMIGFLWEWLREHKHRSTATTKAREVARLERELAVLQDSRTVGQQDDVLALLETKKAG